MRLPGVDRRTYAAQASDGGVLWHIGDGTDEDPEWRLDTLMGCLGLIVEEPLSVERLRARWKREQGSENLPTIVVAHQLCDAVGLLRPVVNADESFRNLVALRGAAIAQAAFSFTSPTMALLRTAVEHASYLDRLPEWLDDLGWSELVAIAKKRDTAAQAVMCGHAFVEGEVSHDLVIRLREPRHAT
ncbi:hypothetical protein [Brytella acorum]|uniref:Uncharacterized protein n=1 Tax=Brytella acorum TaxID=2959299 RepID=A0AA35VBR9_9PROT|nr:hypothetical protein [Brytella acorum]MDF3625713.1 hypothetical protein [Brytella acorum]CAI9121342.1 hypothetical protein LMG32879_002189 [Brytella acorum]